MRIERTGTHCKIVAQPETATSLLHPGERTGPEGKAVHNGILLSLSDREFRAIRNRLEFTGLAHHGILHESQRPARNVYFLNEGLVSMVVVMSNGKTAEAGVVGNEGVVGMEALFGMRRSPLREIVQIAGTAHRISGGNLQALLRAFPNVLMRFSRFAIINRMQISQTAACNRLHAVEERLARWLLLTQDRVQSGFIPMTHDFLATMLGTDRGSVTEAAGSLQKARIIEYSRGSVRVLNRRALEASSCECYELIRGYNGELFR